MLNEDFIVLKRKIDISALESWYNIIENEYSTCKFNFFRNVDLLKPSIGGKFTTSTDGYTFDSQRNDTKGLESYTLTWPVQTLSPLPPPWAANLDIFPELLTYFDKNGNPCRDIDYLTHNYLEQYNFGEWNNIISWLGKYIYNPRISIHTPGFVIKPHTDDYVARLHIPITNDGSIFCWGDNLEREYKFELGNVYIINSKLSHGTKNLGNTYRANLMADIVPDKLLELLKL